MARWRRTAAALHLAVAVAIASPTALFAQPAAPAADAREKAAELKRRGDSAMENIKYDEALAAYGEAFDLVAEPALLYNKGRALQALSRFPEALVEFERFQSVAPPELKAKVPKLNELIMEVRGRVSIVRVECNVAGARILVRERVMGTTPLPKPIHVVAGRAEVQIEAEGYLPYRKETELPGGGSIVLQIDLVPAKNAGVLVVNARPLEASVAVDGKAMGRSPVEMVLSVGPHRVKVSHDGYTDAETSAMVPLNGRKEVSLNLEKTPPIVAKWWFWTGVGVVVAGGVVLTVALLTEKSAGKGDIAPGQVSGPLVRF